MHRARVERHVLFALPLSQHFCRHFGSATTNPELYMRYPPRRVPVRSHLSPQDHRSRHLRARVPLSLYPSLGPGPTKREVKIRVLGGVGAKMAAMTYACGGKATVDVQKVVDVVRAAGAAIMQVYTEDAKVDDGHGGGGAAAAAAAAAAVICV